MLPPILSVQEAKEMREYPLAVTQRTIDLVKDRLNLYGKVEFELPLMSPKVHAEVIERLSAHFESAGYVLEPLKDTNPNKMRVRIK